MKIIKHATAVLLLLLTAIAAFGAKPGPGTLPPSAVIFSGSYNLGAQPTYSGTVNVPQDGAWLYGHASSSSIYQDCVHHYEVDLNPSTLSPNYNPLLTLGPLIEADYATCSNFGQCLTCQVDWGGQRFLTYYTTNNNPAWLPAGSGSAVLQLSSGDLPASLSFSLNQVNMNIMQGMTVFEAQSNTVPAQADQAEIDSRAYIPSSDDRVPLVPQFTYGTDVYPSPPSNYITYSGTWDTGDPLDITQTNPYPGGLPGHAILLIKIPSMKSGNHKITLKATLPSGKTFSAPAYQVFVYNAALETSINGGAFNVGPAAFDRASNVVFRINQQDAKGKTLKITAADWKFHALPPNNVDIVGSDDGLAPNAAQWGGTMMWNGLVSAQVTLQVGKSSRTSHAGIATTAIAMPRTGSAWTVPQSLCQNCWDDLGTTNGGSLDLGLLLPTDQNVIDTLFFASSGILARGQTGDRLSYENGIRDRDNPSSYKLDPGLTPKPWPLYRPFDGVNDPSDWPNRYSIAQIPSGPNRLFWYVTQQNFRIAYGYAAVAYFNPTSAAGASSSAYASFVYNSSCGNASDQGCYALTPLTCWNLNYLGQSYFQAASATINPTTSAPYDMSLLYTQIQTHEKTRHWDEAVVKFLVDHPEFDLGKMLERIASRDSNETDARARIDGFIWDLNDRYLHDLKGGAYEVFTDPHTDAPLIEDIPIGNASCGLYHP